MDQHIKVSIFLFKSIYVALYIFLDKSCFLYKFMIFRGRERDGLDRSASGPGDL